MLEVVTDDLAVKRRLAEHVAIFRTRKAGSTDRAAKSRARFVTVAIAGDVLAAAVMALVAASVLATPLGYLVIPATAAAWIAVAGSIGLYASRRISALHEAEKVVSAAAVATLVASAMSGVTGGAIALLFGCGLATSAAMRWLRRGAMMRARVKGDLRRRTLIIGTDAKAGTLSYDLRDLDDEHDPIGFVAAGGPLVSPDGLAVVGTMDELPRLIADLEVERVVVHAASFDATQLAEVVDRARRAGVEACIRTAVPPMRVSRISVEPIAGTMAMTVSAARLSRAQAFFKRAIDLAIGLPILLLSLPVGIIIAAAIRLTSRGPALFRQVRATKDGRAFSMIKFRTMVVDQAKHMEGLDPTAPFFKVRKDPRVTRVGRVLRRLSLDELPQLWNVVRGDMSLVGPRPLPVEQVESNWDVLAPRHEVRAGMTGWWQVNGRDDSDLEQSLRLDLYYVRNWSVLLDVYIVWRTLGAMIDRRGSV